MIQYYRFVFEFYRRVTTADGYDTNKIGYGSVIIGNKKMPSESSVKDTIRKHYGDKVRDCKIHITDWKKFESEEQMKQWIS